MKHKPALPKQKKGNRLAKIRGILIPAAWDEMGKVVTLGLSGIDERQYLIARNEKQEELFDLIQTEVVLRGLLKEQAGNKMILVKRWSKVSRGTYPKLEERR